MQEVKVNRKFSKTRSVLSRKIAEIFSTSTSFRFFKFFWTVFVHFCTQASLPKISLGVRSGQGDLAGQFMFPVHPEQYCNTSYKGRMSSAAEFQT